MCRQGEHIEFIARDWLDFCIGNILFFSVNGFNITGSVQGNASFGTVNLIVEESYITNSHLQLHQPDFHQYTTDPWCQYGPCLYYIDSLLRSTSNYELKVNGKQYVANQNIILAANNTCSRGSLTYLSYSIKLYLSNVSGFFNIDLSATLNNSTRSSYAHTRGRVDIDNGNRLVIYSCQYYATHYRL